MKISESALVKKLLSNINRQAVLSDKIKNLTVEQNHLEHAILGDLIPEYSFGNPDLREELALSTVDGNKMSMDTLLSILQRAKEQLKKDGGT